MGDTHLYRISISFGQLWVEISQDSEFTLGSLSGWNVLGVQQDNFLCLGKADRLDMGSVLEIVELIV